MSSRVFAAFVSGMVLLGGCSGAADVEDEVEPDVEVSAEPDVEVTGHTPEDLLLAGPPVFVLGTRGDDFADRVITTQVDLFRGFLAEPGTIELDTSIDDLPDNAVLYGGPEENAALPEDLPFSLDESGLTIGGSTYDGPGIGFVAVVPGTPEFLLYAGTPPGGVAEINGRSSGAEQILVADAFGTLTTGRWLTASEAEMAPTSRRIAWRAVDRAPVRVLFPEQLPPAADEAQVVDAVVRGADRVIETLAIDNPEPVDVYVYPDRGSKESLTGRGGDGHAVVGASALHVITADPGEGGPLESLAAHEITHLMGYYAWGPAATPLLAEGLAVWVSGQYAGQSLDTWAAQLSDPPPVASLLSGSAFREAPEQETYPLAGLLIEVAVAEVGAPAVQDHLLGATAATWEHACRQAGTTAEELDRALAARVG